MKINDQIEVDVRHGLRAEAFATEIKDAFNLANRRVAEIILRLKIAEGGTFRFDLHPELMVEMDKVCRELAFEMERGIRAGVIVEWKHAEEKTIRLLSSFQAGMGEKLSKAMPQVFRNARALQAFETRRIKGLNLSDRIWKYTRGFREEMEERIAQGIAEGRSAKQLSRDIRSSLREPNRLFRRVRGERGNLKLSSSALSYHPSSGAYRSSYKNALRLARTEINMSYRQSDFEQWQALDFVLGVEVIRSNHEYDCPVCGVLAGKYPKDFLFLGWHPNCRCHAVPILADKKTIIERASSIIQGEELKPLSPNMYVKRPHVGFQSWVRDNAERIVASSSPPLFIRDNYLYVSKLLNKKRLC